VCRLLSSAGVLQRVIVCTGRCSVSGVVLMQDLVQQKLMLQGGNWSCRACKGVVVDRAVITRAPVGDLVGYE